MIQKWKNFFSFLVIFFSLLLLIYIFFEDRKKVKLIKQNIENQKRLINSMEELRKELEEFTSNGIKK